MEQLQRKRTTTAISGRREERRLRSVASWHTRNPWHAATLLLCAMLGYGSCGDGGGKQNQDAAQADAARNDATMLDARPDAMADAATPRSSNRIVTPPSAMCEWGGETLVQGYDDGRGGGIAGDGKLTAGEVESQTQNCLAAPEPSLVRPQGIATAPTTQPCTVPQGASAASGVTLRDAFANVAFPPNAQCVPGINTLSCTGGFRPVALTEQPLAQRVLVGEQPGRIMAIAPGATNATVALDIAYKVVFGFEPGLLSVAIDPGNENLIYASYITCGPQRDRLRTANDPACPDQEGPSYWALSRFVMGANGVIDPTSETLIIEVEKPATEHNGGSIVFANDGTLLVTVGDGGSYPNVYAQDPLSLLGKVLRLRVNSSPGQPLPAGTPYTIPTDNPFRNRADVRPEIYAIGFRNPWRAALDPLSAEPRLWVGDVGLVSVEEINYVAPGKNYGWPRMEGKYCHALNSEAFGVTGDTSCNAQNTFTLPTYSYVQAKGVSVTGGMVYRGSALPQLRGHYLFADFSLGHIWSLASTADTKPGFVSSTRMLVSTFGEDRLGELYVMDWWTGAIRKLVPTAMTAARPPLLISQTGCRDPAAIGKPASSTIPYGVNSPLFSEAAVFKERYLFLPTGAAFTEYANSGVLIAPPGTVLMKDFSVGNRKIETRFMYLHNDFKWSMWSYVWRSDGSDADLTIDDLDMTVDNVQWHVPNQGECVHCHTEPASGPLALRVEQLNRLGYFAHDNIWANQVDTLRALNMIQRVEPINPELPISDTNSRVVPLPPAAMLPAVPAPNNTSAPLVARVGAYLEVNCSHCHRPAGGGRGDFNLMRDTFLRGVCNTLPQSQAYDDPAMRLIKPGDPDHSAILVRMKETVLPYRMHPYRITTDEQGIALIREWIMTTAAADCAAIN